MARRAVDEEPATHIGNDDGEFAGDVAVRIVEDEAGSRRAMFVPQRLRNASAEQQAVMLDIQALVRENMRVLDALAGQVEVAREVGLSWGSIGWLVGMSGRGAQKRWSE